MSYQLTLIEHHFTAEKVKLVQPVKPAVIGIHNNFNKQKIKKLNNRIWPSHKNKHEQKKTELQVSLIGTVDEVTAPDQVLWAAQHTLAAVQQEAGKVDQRVLHQEAQRILQAVAHLRHEAAHLGHAVDLPARLLQTEPAGSHIPQAGANAVAQGRHPRVTKEQLNLHRIGQAKPQEK